MIVAICKRRRCRTANYGAHRTAVPGEPDLEATRDGAITLATLVSALVAALLAQNGFKLRYRRGAAVHDTA